MINASSPYAFLSYSRKDQAFAAHLARDLRTQGIHLWFDQADITPGEDWDEAIQRALHGAQSVLFIVSNHSVHSDNVLNELTVALDARKWVIPLMIAAAPLPLRIARMQRIDFVPHYGTALARLVAYMRGGVSRTTALEQIATSSHPPGESNRPTQPPVQFSTPVVARKRTSWVVPALIGAAVAVFGLFGLLVVIAALAPSGAGSSGAGGIPAASTDPTVLDTGFEIVQGNWLGACQPSFNGMFSRISLTINRSMYANETTYYAVADCSEPQFTISLVQDVLRVVELEHGQYAADYRARNISFVPIASAEELNRQGVLGFRNWRDGTPTELPTPTVTQLFGIPLRPGTATYDLVAVEGNTLREGHNINGHVALRPEDRPVALDDVSYARQ